MKMELLQPFINAADAVLADMLQCSPKIDDVSMEDEIYRRKGAAAVIVIRGDIEGRVILDLDPATAMKVACHLAGAPVEESEEIVRETVKELGNMVIGNAVTLLNNDGYRFKVFPPEVHTDPTGFQSDLTTEALVMSFNTPSGLIYLNIAMRPHQRRRGERAAAVVS